MFFAQNYAVDKGKALSLFLSYFESNTQQNAAISTVVKSLPQNREALQKPL